MKIGDHILVKAEENPSTGYQWMLLDEELQFHGLTDSIKMAKSTFEPPPSEPEKPILVGTPGIRHMELVGLKES